MKISSKSSIRNSSTGSRATILFFLFLAFSAHPRLSFAQQNLAGQAANPLDVVINEIAWMGTETSTHNEWIELYNNTDKDINLEGWGIYEAGGKILIEPLTGIIKAKSYYLIERTDDTTIPDILASQKPTGWGGRGLSNRGEHLQLKDSNSAIIDEINSLNKWFAGDNSTKQTMERINSLAVSDTANWGTSQNPGGTPKAKNSITVKPETLPERPVLESKPEPMSELSENRSPSICPSGAVNTSTKVKSPQIIDINTASLKELQKITDIGPVLAQRIIDARPFYSIDELIKVRGIGPKTLENIKKQGLAWVAPELRPPKIEKEIESPKKGLAAVAEPFKQESLAGGIPKSLSVFLIALVIALFSGAIILILKKKLKTKELL